MTITSNGHRTPDALTAPLAQLAPPPGAARRRARAAAASSAHGVAVGWRWVAGKVRPWRLAAKVPALGGAALVAAGAGMMLQSFAGAGGWGLGLLAGGAFLLRIDSRI